VNEPVNMFACPCGAQSEGKGTAPACWLCGEQMHHWKTRVPQWRSTTLEGEAADRRNASGGW